MGGRLPWAAGWLVPAFLAGSLLRSWGIRTQLFLGDEIHAVASAVRWSLPKIVATYRLADHCIPLASYDRILSVAGIPLTEATVRLPVLVAGLLALVVLPRTASGLVNGRAAIVFGWLVALSPTLVYYGRIARPYGIIVLLGWLALVCFWRFWRGRQRGWAVGYGVAGAAATWFHVGTAPFVAAPLLWALGDLLVDRWDRSRRRDVADLAIAGGLLAAGITLHLAPALRSFLVLLGRRGGDARSPYGAIPDVLMLQAGTVTPWIAGAFVAVGALGALGLARRRPRLASFLALPLAVQVLALLLFRPSASHLALVFHRYLLVALPVILLWTACGLTALWGTRGAGWLRWTGRAAVVVLAAGWAAAHPYAVDPGLRLGPFGGSNAAAAFYRPVPGLPTEAVPRSYRLIGSEPGDAPLVELPGGIGWFMSDVHAALWRVHGRDVVVATELPFDGAGAAVSFRTVIPAEPAAIEASGARFVLLHRDLPRLRRIERALERGELERSSPVDGFRGSRPNHPEWQRTAELRRRFREAWGAPRFLDEGVIVWDLWSVGRQPPRSVPSASPPLPPPGPRGTDSNRGLRRSRSR